MPDWAWEGNGYRDLDTGRSVDADQVREWVLESIRKSEDAVAELAQLLTEGKLSLADWRRLMRETIKDEYVAFFLLGLGGLELLREEEIRQLVELLVEQYAYLDQFVVQMGEGLPSNAQIIARSRSYIRSAGSAYWVATYDAVTRGGMTEVKWTMNPAEHCEDCIAFAGMGWQPIEEDPYHGAVPRSGDTRCLFNCLCVLEFS
jgi:hypothetical protein